MCGKNNKKLLKEKQSDKVYSYAIKRLTVGVASVAISAGFLFAGGTIASAADEALAGAEVSSEASNLADEAGLTEEEPEVNEPEVDTVSESTAESEAVDEDKVFVLSQDQRARLKAVNYTESEIDQIEQEIRHQLEANPSFDVEGEITRKVEQGSAVSEGAVLPMNARAAATQKADNETYKAAVSKTRVRYKKGTVGDAKEAIDKENLATLPVGTTFDWVDRTIFEKVGDVLAEIRVTYPDGSSEIIKAPISISIAYQIGDEVYSGNFYSDEVNANTTSNPGLNVGFAFDSLESSEARATNELGMQMSFVGSGGITGSGRNKMYGYLELDDRLAKYVDRIEGSRNGDGQYFYEWERVRNDRGELTNTWKQKAFSMLAEPGEQGRNTLFTGDSPSVTFKNPSNKIIFKETIRDIIEKEVPNVENGDLIYKFFMADENMVIQNQSEDEGYITVAKEQAHEHPEAIATNNRNWFSNSHTVLTYHPDAGVNGGFSFDHILVKNSDGGTLNNYRDIANRDWAYKFKIDERLLPYVESVEAHFIDGTLTQGFNFKIYNSAREHSKYQAAAPQGYLGRGREGWVNYEMRFNSKDKILSQYTAAPDGAPQKGLSGSMGEIAWFDTNKGANDKATYRYNVLKSGEGYFTLDNAPINFGSEQVWFSPGSTQDAVVRLVLKIKKDVSLNDVLTANGGKDTNYGISGYFVNSKEELIPNTNAQGHLRVTDSDDDGVADAIDDKVETPTLSQTDADKYTPVVKDVTTSLGKIPDAKEGIAKFIDKDGKEVTPTITDYRWEIRPDVSKEGTFENAVVITYEDGTSARIATKIIVIDNRKDNEKYEPEVDSITKEHGTPTTEDEVKNAVSVSDYQPDPASPYAKPVVTVDNPTSLPDGKTSGTTEVAVTVTYPDGTTDQVTVPVTVKKVKLTEAETYKPVVAPVEKEKGQSPTKDDVIGAVTVPDYQPDPATPDKKPVVTVDDRTSLPDGNTPGTTEVSVTVTYPDGTEDKVKVPVTIKDTTAPEIAKLEDKTVTEKKPIDPIKVETNEEGSKVLVDDLPDGLSFNKDNSEITGTPTVSDWNNDEETRDFPVTVNAEDEAGNKARPVYFTITVERDTDGDGTPDKQDEDDDNDGVTDEVEKEKGTDPKDRLSKPDLTPPRIGYIGDKTVLEKKPIEDIPVYTNEEAEIKVDGLPEGLSYDQKNKKITGTPNLTDWTKDQEQKEFDVTIIAEDEAGNKAELTFKITIIRDTDGDGIPDQYDKDDDGDGVSDEDEIAAGTDPKNEKERPWTGITEPKGIKEIEDQTVVEGNKITEVTVEPEDEKAILEVSGLPAGVNFEPTTKLISGTPVIENWGEEEEKEISVSVKANNEDGTSITKTFIIKVQRDTDKDGDPDVTDLDDDNDGVSDEDEKEKGTDSKNAKEHPFVPIEDIAKTTKVTTETIKAEVKYEADDSLNFEEKVVDKAPVDGEKEITTVSEPGKEDVVTEEVTKEPEAGTTRVGNKKVETVENEDGSTTETTTIYDVDPDTGELTNPTTTTKTTPAEEYLAVFNGNGGSPATQKVTVKDGEVVTGITEPTREGYKFVKWVKLGTNNEFDLSEPFSKDILGGEKSVIFTAFWEKETSQNGGSAVFYPKETHPIFKTVGDELTEKEITNAIVVLGLDRSKYTVTINEGQTLPSTDQAGDAIIDVTITFEDGTTDDAQVAIIITEPADTTAPVIDAANVIAVEGQPIPPVLVDIDDLDATVTVDGLPEGLTYNPETKEIEGTIAKADDWEDDEEEKSFTATITATDAAGNIATKDITVTVLRDTDGDGTPDVTDEDDDNDGVTDEVEKEKGTDPKDVNERPLVPIEEIPGTDITNKDQTVTEKNPIKDIVITPGEEDATVTIGELPDGLTYDEETRTISGTPEIDDWGKDEEERKITVPVTTENPDGSQTTEDVTITVERDTDGDGTPDKQDEDDDNDGVTDEVEKENGTDPKDPNSKPGKITDSIDPVIPERTEVGDVNDLTESEREHVKEAIEEANKDNFPEGTKVTVNEDGSATITYPDGSKDSIPADELIFQDAKGDPEIIDKPELKIADILDPVLPERTEVGDVDDLTQSEREHVKDAIEEANKDNFPEGTDVTVNEDGSATITYPDGSKDNIKAEDLIKQAEEETSQADQIDPVIPERTEVGDVDDLTQSEREHVKEAIEEANKDNFPEGTDVTINEDGSATITYPDGSKDSIPADQLIFQREDDSDAEEDDQPSLADQIDIILPEKTGVKDINNLTEIEKEKVKIAITDANKLPKGTEVLVGSKGDVIINYPDGSHDVIDGKDLVYQLLDSETGKPADPDKGGTPSEPGTGDADKGSDDASDSKGGDKDSSKDKDSKGGDQGSSKDSKAKDSQDKLPQTGESSSAAILGLAGLSIMAGLGLVAGRRKEDN